MLLWNYYSYYSYYLILHLHKLIPYCFSPLSTRMARPTCGSSNIFFTIMGSCYRRHCRHLSTQGSSKSSSSISTNSSTNSSINNSNNKRISSHYLRELQRHIQGTDRTSHGTGSRPTQRNHVLIGTVSLLGFACSLPMLCFFWVGRSLTDQEEPLSASQIRRGAFLNSGSRDAGRDPNWVKGRYQRDDSVYKNSNEVDVGNELLRLSQQR
jgi:hypothetical protein